MKLENALLSELLEKLRLLGGTFVIPEPVIVELVQGARETHASALLKSKTAEDNWQRLGVNAPVSYPTAEDFIKDYKLALDDFIKQNNVKIIGYPIKMSNTEKLFELAVAKRPPFDRKGNSYRDAVIFSALKEFADSHSEKVYFISKDGNFSDLLDDSGLGARIVCGSTETIIAEVSKMLSEAYLKREAEIKEGIMSFLIANTKLIDNVAKATVVVNLNIDFPEELYEIRSFNTLHLIDVPGVFDVESERASFTALAVSNVGYSVRTTKAIKSKKTNAWQLVADRIKSRPKKVGQKNLYQKTALHSTQGFIVGSLGNLPGGISYYDSSLNDEFIDERTHRIVVRVEGKASISNDKVVSVQVENVIDTLQSPYDFVDLEGELSN